jgi:O-6-methylguanine DNA methyltransferase
MAKNRLAVIIPCHRVIGSNGGLHGYGGGGLEKKARLLQMERMVPGEAG